MDVNPVSSFYGVTLQGRLGQTCGEEAFRYLLDTERRRAERSSRPILLLLVSVKKPGSDPIPPNVAATIFRGLWECVREVDFIGWFREGRVAGVVLTQGAAPLLPEVPRRLGDRIARVLREHVASTVADHLHVQVLELRSARKRRAV